MDPNQRRRPDDADHLSSPPVPTGPAASTGNLVATASNPGAPHHPQRNASPSPNRRSQVQPPTPVVEGESETEYFPTLDSDAPSLSAQPSNLSLPQGRPHSTSNVSSNRPRSLSARSGASGSLDGSAPTLTRTPSIRIRRRSSSQRSRSSWRPGSNRNSANLSDAGSSDAAGNQASGFGSSSGSGRRPRSVSQPDQAYIPPQDTSRISRRSKRTQAPIAMPRLTEEGSRPTMDELGLDPRSRSPQSLPDDRLELTRNQTAPGPSDGPPRLQRMRNVSRFFWPRRGDQSSNASEPDTRTDEELQRQDEYDERLVDYLDTVDPEVQTLSTLTNVQNSLFVPDLGSWLNRRPTYTLSDHDIRRLPPKRAPPPPPSAGGERMAGIAEHRAQEEMADQEEAGPAGQRPPMERTSTITSRLTESHYAALPHGATLEGWSREEKEELDDHVRHMLHSRRSKFKRTMKGFGQYVRRPLGFLVTLYATLITLFGLAWVLFLIGWIYVGDKQVYVIHIIDSVLVALFAIMGDGLAPFRAVDTYHMIFIVHYARIVKNKGKRARSRLLKTPPPEIRESVDVARAIANSTEPEEPLRRPEEADGAELESQPSNDPHTMRNNIVDADDTKSGIEAYEDTPLTYKQQQKLHHHQTKLAKSHTYYKPHETGTHFAFPLGYLIAIIILCDCHSLLQISLGACTWGIDYRTRPFALTTVILCVSITCNVTSGIVIAVGDRKTRKKDVWQLMTRQELTGDAMRMVEQKRSNSNKDDNSPTSGLSKASSYDPGTESGTRYLHKAPSPEAEQEKQGGEKAGAARKLSKRDS